MTRHRIEPRRWRDTLEQERREVLKSVLEVIGNESIRSDAIENNQPDPDLLAACSYLIRHLMRHLAFSDRPSKLVPACES